MKVNAGFHTFAHSGYLYTTMLNFLNLTKHLLIAAVITGGLLAGHNPAFGQEFRNMKQAEDSLSSIVATLNKAETDSLKDIVNDHFYLALQKALMLPSADDYPFESLKTLAKIGSDDSKFRIYHWNLPTSDGKKRYFGFLKLLHRNSPVVYQLRDYSDSIPDPETAILDCNHWFAALYYTAITGTTAAGKTFYTLLGWSGNNASITQKVIDIVTFDEQDTPRFGLPVFPDFDTISRSRIIFRFSASTSMSLKYEEQILSTSKKWNAKNREFDTKANTAKMIVCDRLVPLDPQLEGQFQFYIPAGETYDGFQFVDGHWHFIRGIETRNRH